MNGNVKVILVGGFSVMFGFYVFMIQGVNNRIVQIGDQKSYYTQARLNSTAGLNHAIYTMKNEQNWWSLNNGNTIAKNNLLTGGDTASYLIERPLSLAANEACVTVTAKYGSVAAKQIAVIRNISKAPPYSSSGSTTLRCQVVKVYVYPYQLPDSELN